MDEIVPLIEELQKLTDLSKDCLEELLVEQIKRIVEEDTEIIYQIIYLFVTEKIDLGYSKEYSLSELQEKLPWKKSRLIEKLQKIVEEGVLVHKKRKYKLKKENELVKRKWNYYNETGFQEKEKNREIWKLILRKKELEKACNEKLKIEDKTRFRELKVNEEKIYRKEIIDEIKSFFNAKQPTLEFLEKNIIRTMGYKKNN